MEGTPDVVTDGAYLLPALMPVYAGFLTLSRGRDFTAFGTPLPLKTRDIREELEFIEWADKAQLRRWLIAMDDVYLELMSKRSQDV